MLKRLCHLAVVIVAFCAGQVHAQCTLPASATQAQFVTAMGTAAANSCGGAAPNTVQFVPGNSSITSQVGIPCAGSAGLIIQGPVLATNVWPPAPTAVLTNNGITNNWGFSGGACNNPVTIQYLEWNGNQPSGGGGGFLHIPLGMNKVTVQWNYIHGNMALQTTQQRPDTHIYLDGGYSGTHTQNVTIRFNKFGNTGSGDCGGNAPSSTGKGVMSLMGSGGGPGTCSGSGYAPPGGSSSCLYQGAPNLNAGGGSCAAFGLATNTDNFTFANNSVQEQEQGGKCFKNNNGNTTSTNTLLQFNDFSGIHRIGYEAQCNDGLTTVDSNDLHDPFQPDANSWALSVPQGNTTSTNNLLIANTTPINDRNGNPPSGAGNGIEFWGGNTSSSNLIQGRFGGGILYGFSPGGASVNNNIFQMSVSTQYIVNEENGPTPSQSGNVTGATVSARASVAPTISPTPVATYSSPIAVTITDPGYTTGAGPRGNHSIYYTIDGSTPTTTSGTWCASPCNITVSPGTTVNAIGMWGALNQPKSYASGFGFVPSAVMGAHYSAGSTPTLTGVSFSLTGGGSTLLTGNSVQGCATATYSSGSPIVTCGNGPDTFGTTFGTWTSTQPTHASISSSGLVLGVGAGSTNLTVKATQGATTFTSSAFTITVSNPTPVLTGVTISDGGVSTIGSTQTVQATATAQYTLSVTQNCTATPDPFGTTCGTWLSSSPAAATISSSGLVSGVAAGSTNLTVKATAAGGTPFFTSSPLALAVTGPPPVATLTGVTITCAQSSVQAGNTDACAANCAYTIGPSTNCTTTDGHGTLAFGWLSGTPATATVSSSGVATAVAAGTTSLTVQAGSFTSPGFTLTVTAIPPITPYLGDPVFDTAGQTSPSFINATYAVTGGTAAGYNATSCSFYLPTGTYSAGSKWDCGLIPAPSSTTQSPNWLCWNTYTNSGTAADVGWHTVSLPTCGVLPPSTAYWVGVVTNNPGRPGEGFSLCSGSPCTGSAPTIGSGTFPCAFVSASYGVYTGMATAVHSGCGAPGVQASQYVTLGSPLPTLVSAFLANPGPTLILSLGGSVQFSVFCVYTDGTTHLCFPGADQYGSTATAFASDNTAAVTVGNIGSVHPGLATSVGLGSANISATVTGGITTDPLWNLTVSSTPLPYPPSSPRGLSR